MKCINFIEDIIELTIAVNECEEDKENNNLETYI